MKYGQAFLLFCGAFILQPFINKVSIQLGAAPNLLLSLTVVMVFLYKDKYFGIIFGILFGLLYDICYGQYIGTGSLGIIVAIIFVLTVRDFVNIENLLSIIIITAFSTLLYSTAYWIIMRMTGSVYGYLKVLEFQPWYIGFNVIVAVAIYLILIKKIIRYRKDRYFR